MSGRETLVLRRGDVVSALRMDACIAALEDALRRQATGGAIGPDVLAAHVEHGGFHVKAAGLRGERIRYAVKTNANFPENRRFHDLPTIQGVVALFDGENGRLLALMDSGELTAVRTGAATAVAAKHLARPRSSVATIIGCGVQARAQLLALTHVLPINRVYAIDIDGAAASRFADEMSRALGITVTVSTIERVKESDVVVTCTSSTRPVLAPTHVPPGVFIAAVGADNPHKQELDPQILATAKLVCDSTQQCAEFGELSHAIAARAKTRDRVHAEIADIVAGQRPGRATPDEITVYDSTGTAMQDVAAAIVVYDQARARGLGTAIQLAA